MSEDEDGGAWLWWFEAPLNEEGGNRGRNWHWYMSVIGTIEKDWNATGLNYQYLSARAVEKTTRVVKDEEGKLEGAGGGAGKGSRAKSMLASYSTPYVLTLLTE